MLMQIEDEQIRTLERDLKIAASHAFPFATLDALNRAVAGAQIQIRRHLDQRMTLRNQWTKGSIQIRKARGLDVERQAAEVGSAAEYMAEQEEGFTRRARGRHGVPIPTSAASGQPKARPRRRKVSKSMRLANIHIAKHRGLGVNQKQRNVRSVQEAVKTGKRFVFLEFKTKKGIYKVMGGSKKVKRGWPKGASLRLVWSLSKRTVTTPKHQWLDPELDTVVGKIPELYRRALTKQLKRLGVLTEHGKYT